MYVVTTVLPPLYSFPSYSACTRELTVPAVTCGFSCHSILVGFMGLTVPRDWHQKLNDLEMMAELGVAGLGIEYKSVWLKARAFSF
jgi:hypothetical protein